MKVIGNAGEAISLAKNMLLTAKDITDETDTLEKNLNTLGGSFKDAEFQQVEEVVQMIYKALNQYADDIANTSQVLVDYAEILARK